MKMHVFLKRYFPCVLAFLMLFFMSAFSVEASSGSTDSSSGALQQDGLLLDFEENNFGFWNVQDDTGIDLWRIGNGRTPSSFTGPIQSQEGDYYGYIESSDQNFPYKIGYLESPQLEETPGSVTFYYHMHGENIGELSVEYYNGTTWQFAGWKQTGQQHVQSQDDWTYANLNLYGLPVEKIRFKAETGEGFQGDIAIDNISINMGGGDSGGIGGVSLWSRLGNMIHYNLGNVGIGVDSPTEKLEVGGNIKANSLYVDEICINGDCSTSISESSNDSTAYENIYEDNGNVGIGSELPTEKLEVDGAIKANDITLTRKASCSKLYTDVNGNVLCGIDASNQGIRSVSAGEGLTGGGEVDDISISVDTQVIQKRVTSVCPEGQSINEIREDGSVVCSGGSAGKIKALKVYGGATYQVCASFSDKSFRCWGYNANNGGIGLGRLGGNRYTPAHMIFEDVKDVALGYESSCAVTNSGEVYCWGYGSYGENGDGNNLHTYVPLKVAGLSDVKKVARTGHIGDATFCALKNDGKVYCWGRNNTGQIGDGTTATRYVPTHIATLSSISDIAGFSSTRSVAGGFLALSDNGEVWAWGNNGSGQIGDGTTSQKNAPVKIDTLSNIVKIYAGGDDAGSSFAIDGNGDVYAWGYNGLGQLGLGNTGAKSTPTKITALSNVEEIVATQGFHYVTTCALKTDGSLYCWGYNGHGAVGDGTNANKNVPIYIMDDVKTIMPAYRSNTKYAKAQCALKNNGEVYCWGYNGHGAIGNGGSADIYSPTKVLGLRNITQIFSRNYADVQTNYAIDENGDMYSWGYNGHGQLGIGEVFTSVPVPAKVPIY